VNAASRLRIHVAADDDQLALSFEIRLSTGAVEYTLLHRSDRATDIKLNDDSETHTRIVHLINLR